MKKSSEIFIGKSKYDFQDLLDIMQILRNDCKWDSVQTHFSIRNNFIEEVYEAIEAIDNTDDSLLQEELGDVLLQVVFHSQISKDTSSFEISDVITGICKKLIRRHPHIFADVVANDIPDILNNWDEIKKIEKGQITLSDTLEQISKSLPSLLRAEKIQKKISKSNIEFNDINISINKVNSNVLTLKSITNNSTDKNKILGDLLFSIVNISRLLNINAEQVLYDENEKYINYNKKLEVTDDVC